MSAAPGRSAVLIAGCGYVGARVAEGLARDGARVIALRRSAAQSLPGVEHRIADLRDPASLRDLPSEIDRVVYALSADERTEGAYRDAYVRGLEHLLDALDPRRIRRLVYVSSTAVYGQDDGGWIDETSPTVPSSFGGRVLLEGEAIARRTTSCAVLRLAGIYGPGRSWLIRRVHEGTARIDEGAVRYGNRIHRDDCAGAIRHLLDAPSPKEIVLGVDDDPAPLGDVYRFVAKELGVADPILGEDTASRGGNKRCSNQSLLESGYRLRVPSYREGYPPIIAEYLAERAAEG